MSETENEIHRALMIQSHGGFLVRKKVKKVKKNEEGVGEVFLFFILKLIYDQLQLIAVCREKRAECCGVIFLNLLKQIK